MPVIKKPRYVAQIKGESVVRLFFPSLPLSLSFLSSFFPLSLFFFFITGCGLFRGSGQIYFRRDSRKNELANREMQMRFWYRIAVRKMNPWPGLFSPGRGDSNRTLWSGSPISLFLVRSTPIGESSIECMEGGVSSEKKKREKKRKGKGKRMEGWIYFFFFVNKLKIWKNLLDVVVVEIDMYK